MRSLMPTLHAALRMVAAFVYLLHGLQKFGLLGDPARPLLSLLGAAGTIEAVAGGLILIGLFTRPAAFVASGQMAAAYFIAHAPRGALPVHNGGDPAVLLSFVFLYIWAAGPGAWSVDGLRKGSTRS